jgi:hypothetical protein
MATQLKMFDRTDVMALLERDCLGAIGGSASIVGALKVGKTRLLEHIASRPATDNIVCRVDPPSLCGFLTEGEQLSDHTFLRFFVVQILEQVDEWEDKLSLQEDGWKVEMRKADQRLTVGGLDRSDREALEVTRTALQQQLNDLRLLRELKTEAESLVKNRALESSELWRMFSILKKLRKRVVLLIDDFDELVDERGFSDKLFNFLRGANNQGKIFAIVFSPSRPMETATRPRDLFNHLKAQLLEPFNEEEAKAFLDWDGFPKPNPPLTEAEKAYLYQLGGGSAHFLQIARERFLQENRPATDPTRSELQKRHLVKDFAAGFWAVWRRCDEFERTAIRDLVSRKLPDQTIVNELEWKGYFVRDPQGSLRLFSILFEDFVSQNPKEPKAPNASLVTQCVAQPQNSGVEIETVVIPYTVFPTALYAASPDSAEQVIFQLKNSSIDPVVVQLSCSVTDYFQETRKTVTLPPGSHQIALRLVFDKTKFVSGVVATQVEYRVSLITGNTEPVLKADSTELVRLLPSNNFLMARYDSTKDELVNFTWLIAAWITRDSDRLRAIRRRAIELEPLVGQKVLPGPNAARETRIRVAAIYKALQEQNIVFNDDNVVFHAQENDYVQRVQFPIETIDTKAGNCLDGSVLFGSVLSMCGIGPLILLVPGHAVVGWNVPGEGKRSEEFCETTVMPAADFDLAWEIGRKKYATWQHALRADDAEVDIISDPKDFAFVIDVHKTWSARKLIPAASQ